MFRIQRTDNQVAVGYVVFQQRGTDVSILRHIPCSDIGRDTISLQTVASHQHAAIVLRHALAVAIFIVQRQHHPNTYRTLAHVSIGLTLHRRLGHHVDIVLRLLAFGKRNLDNVTFLQFVARSLHLRIGINQFLHRNAIVTGYAEDGLFALYLV